MPLLLKVMFLVLTLMEICLEEALFFLVVHVCVCVHAHSHVYLFILCGLIANASMLLLIISATYIYSLFIHQGFLSYYNPNSAKWRKYCSCYGDASKIGPPRGPTIHAGFLTIWFGTLDLNFHDPTRVSRNVESQRFTTSCPQPTC